MTKRIYDSRQWRSLRAMKLRQDPLCQYCKRINITTPATIADHIVPVNKRPDLAFCIDNLQSLCSTCHSSIKAKEERSKRPINTGFDAFGSPIKWHESTY